MITGLAKNLISLIFIIIIMLGFAYVAVCTVGNWQAMAGNQYNMPNANKAQYSLRIRNTGNVLLTNNLERQGDIYILDGYWQLDKSGRKFVYVDAQTRLDLNTFGKVEIIKRQ